MSYCIYTHTNKTNGKTYVGLTSMLPEERWRCGKGYHKGTHFRNAIDKYGWDGFEHKIIKDNLTKEEAGYWEQYYISFYNSADRQYGYNMSFGGEHGGHPRTLETRKKISENHGGFDGRKHTEESLEKMRKSHRDNPSHKIPHSEEAKDKMRKAALNSRGRLFLCIELNRIFDNLNDAYRITTCPKGAIVQCCQGKQKQSKGYHWKYVD